MRQDGRVAKIPHADPERTTVGILGDNPVVGEVIAELLRSGGYEARVEDPDLGEPVEPDLVLVTTVHCYPPAPFAAGVPVLWLVDTPEEAERLGGRGLLWPCGAEELRGRIAALARAGAAPV